MPDFVESSGQLCADTLRRGFGRDQRRKGGFERHQPAKSLVVFGIGEDRRVGLVVGPVGRLDLRGELEVPGSRIGLAHRQSLGDERRIDGQAVEPQGGGGHGLRVLVRHRRQAYGARRVAAPSQSV